MKLPIAGALLGAAAAAGVMFALASPGQSEARDPVAIAVSNTTGADFDISGSVMVGGKRTALNGSGAADLSHNRAQMSMTLPLPIVGATKTDAMLWGSYIYVRIPVPGLLTGGKTWARANLGADVFGSLKAVGSSENLGSETIAGVPTTHYRAKVDAKKSVGRIPIGTVPVDVWVDGAGRVRRERMSLSAAGNGADVTLNFKNFGAKLALQPPSQDEVMDAGALLGS